MSKLPVLKPAEVVKALQRLGFVVIRSKGGHIELPKIEKIMLGKEKINV